MDVSFYAHNMVYRSNTPTYTSKKNSQSCLTKNYCGIDVFPTNDHSSWLDPRTIKIIAVLCCKTDEVQNISML